MILSRIQSVEVAAGRLHAVENEIRGLTETLTELKRRHEESTQAVRAADEKEHALRSIAHLLRERAARQGIEEAENGVAQVAAWRGEIDQKQKAAAAVEAGLAQMCLPSSTQLAALKQLDHQLQIARVRLSVGLHAQLRPKRSLKLSVRRDDEMPVQHDLSDTLFETSAIRQIQFDIEDLAELTLSGGAKGNRDEVELLQNRWLTEAQPVFTRAGVTTLDDLVRMTIEAAQRAQEISDARDVAAQLEQRVADQRDWTTLRAVRQRELAAAGDGLGDADREALAATARSLGITDLADTDRLLDSTSD